MDAWRADTVRDQHRPQSGDVAGFGPAGLSLRLTALRRTIECAHPVTVAIDLGNPEAVDGLAPALTNDIHALLQEAASNAARHSGAALVRLGVHLTANTILLRIEDDGKGFPFTGVYDLAALSAFGVGPKNLARRVASLAGTMSLDTRGTGSRLEITLPREQSTRTEPFPIEAMPLLAAG